MTRILLDTHVFLWWRANNPGLSAAARQAIAEAHTVHVSMASAWEVAIKVGLGRLELPGTFASGVAASQFEALPIEFAHTEEVARLPQLHRDPFDRMLVAQARVERLTLVTRDPAVLAYDVAVVLA